MESFRHMPLENIQNCRDLGGYPIKGGGFTKYGRLLRCGRPRASTPNDMEFFREYCAAIPRRYPCRQSLPIIRE